MAYVSKELKAEILNNIKEVAKKHGVKLGFSARVLHLSKIIVNINSCSLDLVDNIKVNLVSKIERLENMGGYNPEELKRLKYSLEHFDIEESLEYGGYDFDCYDLSKSFSGECLELMEDIKKAILCKHYDDSDAMADYFDVAYYWDINIGDGKKGFSVK